ncbi:C-type lectin domain family 7 member A-like [Pteropus medius]|uniref:C-type lectin domain family 7 member A-like n=1 Tax=Pteropus vampyrus TaxID=132908 RepID=UPI00196B7BBD|nr:C-type lectin domain family 7 member A-like [Pteropus giganteus]
MQEETDSNTLVKGYSALLSSWKLIVVVPWIICLVFLVSVGILATNSGNFTWSQETGKKGLISENSGIQPLPTNAKGWKSHFCEDNWHQHGKNCYSFSRNMIPERDYKLHCSISLSSFLKLSTEKEMSKMQCNMHLEKFWISLYYNRSKMKWAWLDSSAFTLDKFQLKRLNTEYNHSKYIKNGQLFDGNCKEPGYCMYIKKTNGD